MTRRVVVVAPFAPATDARHGGARVLHGLLCALVRTHHISIVYVDDGNEPDPFLVENCLAVHAIRPYRPSPARRRLIDAGQLLAGRPLWTSRSDVSKLSRCVATLVRSQNPDVVHVENAVVADVLRSVGVGPSRVVSIQEPASLRRESVRWRSESGGLLGRVDAAIAFRHERFVLRLADAAVVFTERDRDAVRAQGAKRVEMIPLGFDVGDPLPDASGAGDPVLLFVGNFEHPPNVEAAVRLARGVLPQIHRTHRNAVAQIVGASPTPPVLGLRGDHVHVAGDVADVRPYLCRASVVVVPIGTGGGARVKVLEAVAAGKAVVATPRALEGIDVRHGEHVVVAERDDDIAEAVSRLLNNEQERRALGSRAHEWARRGLSWSSMAERYAQLYEELRRPHGMGQ